MRRALICLSLAVAAFAVGGHSTAQAAPWCSTRFGLSCGYYTFQQCLDAIRGDGGSCVQNPNERPGKGRAGAGSGEWTRGGGAQDQRAKQEQRARALEAQKAKQEQRARAAEEQKAKAAKAREEQKAKPAPVAAEPAKPATPPAPPVAVTPAPAAPSAGASARKAAPTDARVYFVGLKNGDDIPSKITLLFGVEKMGVAPAGIDSPNTGHHHLLIDTKVPALDKPIPSDFNHLHFGAGQTEATLTLSPGKHTLQLLFADTDHVPHNPPIMSQPITVTVVPGKTAPAVAEPARPATPPVAAATAAPSPDASPRKAAPSDARVYFVGLKNGDEIPSKVTILFGVEKMGVAPAGIDSPNTGHHHLLVDAKVPVLDKPIPSDFNHLHFGAGQTEATLTLSPGKHTLQLLFADTDHVPHNPPIMSQPITVTVKK
jgi:hypothetical protein